MQIITSITYLFIFFVMFSEKSIILQTKLRSAHLMHAVLHHYKPAIVKSETFST